MLIGIDSSPCSLSLRNRSTLCSTTKCHQIKSDLKNVFVQKFFFPISSILSIPIMLIGINGGYFAAICRVCFSLSVMSTNKYTKKSEIVGLDIIVSFTKNLEKMCVSNINVYNFLCRLRRKINRQSLIRCTMFFVNKIYVALI